mgnify:CR=1 FL=1
MTPGGSPDDEISAFYRKWGPKVQGFLVSTGCDPGLAEEVTDDAFLATARYWKRVREYEHPEYYAFKVARNERSKRQEGHDLRARDLQADPDCEPRDGGRDHADGVADHVTVQQALRELPQRQREAVFLRDAVGLPEAQTAAILGISRGSVKRHTSVGRKRLRSLLREFRDQTDMRKDQD